MCIEQKDCSVRVGVAKLRQCFRKIGIVSVDEAFHITYTLGVVPNHRRSLEWRKFQDEKVAGTATIQIA